MGIPTYAPTLGHPLLGEHEMHPGLHLESQCAFLRQQWRMLFLNINIELDRLLVGMTHLIHRNVLVPANIRHQFPGHHVAKSIFTYRK